MQINNPNYGKVIHITAEILGVKEPEKHIIDVKIKVELEKA